MLSVSPYLKTLSMVAAIKLLHLLEAFSTPWFLFSAPSNHHLVFFLLEIFNNIIQYQFDGKFFNIYSNFVFNPNENFASFVTGNANLVYTIIRKRHVFHALANLPSDVHGITKCLSNRKIAIVGNNQQNVNRTSNHQLSTAQMATTVERKPHENDNVYIEDDEEDEIDQLPSQPKSINSSNEEIETHLESKSDIEESMEGSHPALPAEPGTLKVLLLDTPAIATMTELESAHPLQTPLCDFSPMNEHCDSTTIQDIPNSELSKLTVKENDVEEPSVPQLKRTINQVECIFSLFFSNLMK